MRPVHDDPHADEADRGANYSGDIRPDAVDAPTPQHRERDEHAAVRDIDQCGVEAQRHPPATDANGLVAAISTVTGRMFPLRAPLHLDSGVDGISVPLGQLDRITHRGKLALAKKMVMRTERGV